MNIDVKNLVEINIDIEDIYKILQYNMNIYFSEGIIFKSISVYYSDIFNPVFDDCFNDNGMIFSIKKGTVILKDKKIKIATVIMFNNSYALYDGDVFDIAKEKISLRKQPNHEYNVKRKIEELLKECDE